MDNQEQELKKIEKIMSNSGFWQKDQEEVSRISQQRASLREQIDLWQRLYREAEDGKTLAEMAFEEHDEATLREVEKDVNILQKDINELEFQSLLGGTDDKRNAIIAINNPAVNNEVSPELSFLPINRDALAEYPESLFRFLLSQE